MHTVAASNAYGYSLQRIRLQPPMQNRHNPLSARAFERGALAFTSSEYAFLVLKKRFRGKIFFWGSAPDPVMSDPTLDAPPRRSEGSSRPRARKAVDHAHTARSVSLYPTNEPRTTLAKPLPTGMISCTRFALKTYTSPTRSFRRCKRARRFNAEECHCLNDTPTL